MVARDMGIGSRWSGGVWGGMGDAVLFGVWWRCLGKKYKKMGRGG